ncbi:pentapeptide repeat-containing protein [Nocardioides sp. KIGAM211]|uniref:Pentapeptide repeat-containing protein n=1 Tax=Nocardioides luti TaxID=2761101 RepID=A0A7X0V9C8_9ACTN|nr:pentapeptide repeat-containing protein [Nocardioides luti]
MRFLDEQVVHHGHRDDDDDHVSKRLRLRTRYCLLLAGVLGFLVILISEPISIGARWVASVAWDHWPWALLPLMWLIIGVGITVYLHVAKFFDPGSSVPEWSGFFIGGALAATTALELDNSIGLFDRLEQLPGGWVTVCLAVTGALSVAALLRNSSPIYIDGVELLAGVAALTVVAPSIYLAIRAMRLRFDWSQIASQAAAVIAQNWSPILLALAILYQAPGWRRWFRSRAYARNELHVTPINGLRMMVMAGLTAALAAYVLLYFLPPNLIPSGGLSAAQRADALTQERRTVLATIAAIGAGVTLLYTHLRHQLDRDANATGRYTEAVQQLGDEAMSIRLGGIYALSRVANDSPGDRATVSQVLAAFVRDSSRGISMDVPLDVIAALTELGRKHLAGEGQVNLRSCKLTAGNLADVTFPASVDLRLSDLTATNLHSASLIAANLAQSTLSNAILQDVTARRASFANATVDSVDFTGAQLQDVDMSGADLSGSDLRGADLTGANLRGARLVRANLSGADLTGADLRGVDLTGIPLANARLSFSLLHGTGLTKEKVLSIDGEAEHMVFSESDYMDDKSDEAWERRYRWENQRSRDVYDY